MGFDAHVYCSCWKEGKTKPWPYDFGFHFDEEWGWWRLDQPMPERGVSDQVRREWSQHHHAMRVWMETCCEHLNMELIDRRVANVSGMAAFRWALERIGWEHFPVLRKDMPEYANESFMSPETAQKAIDEALFFNQQTVIDQSAFLLDTATDDVVQIYRPAREGIFRHHPEAEVDIGVDLNGFFIAKRYEHHEPAVDLTDANYRVQQPRVELFRATRFEQRRATQPTNIDYINLEDGSRYTCVPGDGGGALIYQSNLQGDLFMRERSEPRQFHVVTRIITPADFQDTVEDLIAVCQVSVASGNPVYWY